MSASRRIFGLDIVRAAAVSLVVVGHYLQHTDLPKAITNFGRLGIMGVEIFFVLSGYLIGGILFRMSESGRFRTRRDLVTFWSRRWLRTLPLYYLFFLLYLNFDWVGPQRFLDHLNYLVFLQNFAWHIPDFFLLSWSLTIEEYFYLLFPLSLYLIQKVLPNPRRAVYAALSLFLLFPLLLRTRHVPYADWDGFNLGIRMMTVRRLDALMYGVGMVLLEHHHPRAWARLRTGARWALLPFLAACTYIYIDNPGLWGTTAATALLQVVYFPLLSLSVALTLPFFAGLADGGNSATARAITYLSTISYSVYFWHPLVITWVKRFMQADAGRKAAFLDHPFRLYAVYTLAVVALSSLTYYGWERLFLRLRDGNLKKAASAKLAL